MVEVAVASVVGWTHKKRGNLMVETLAGKIRRDKRGPLTQEWVCNTATGTQTILYYIMEEGQNISTQYH